MVSTAEDNTLTLLRVYQRTGDPQAREQLVASYMPLVRRLCRRFYQSREPQEDLLQVGTIGLLNAIEKFDPTHGASFSSLAIPQVLGAILNHLRDHTSLIKVPRALRRKKLTVDRVSERLAPSLGRWPTMRELAVACHLSERDVDRAMEMGQLTQPRSLDFPGEHDETEGTVTLGERLASEDLEFERTLDRLALEGGLASLPTRERTVLRLRFYEGLSQRETAERLAISQMHVSRLERSALWKLRRSLEDDVMAAPDTLERLEPRRAELAVAL